MTKRPLCLACIGLMIVVWMMKQAGVPIFGEPALSPELQDQLRDGVEAIGVGTISERTEKPNSTQYILKNSFLIYQETKIPIHKILLTIREAERYSVGDRIEAAGILRTLQPPGNPGEFDSSAYFACQKIYCSLWGEQIEMKKKAEFSFGEVLQSFRERVTGNLPEMIRPELAGTLSAMVFGERKLLTEDSRLNYQVGGVSHMIAISGVKTLKLDIPLVPETCIKWAFMPLHIAKIYILKLCLDEEIIPRCRFPCSRGYLTKCINQQKKQ